MHLVQRQYVCRCFNLFHFCFHIRYIFGFCAEINFYITKNPLFQIRGKKSVPHKIRHLFYWYSRIIPCSLGWFNTLGPLSLLTSLLVLAVLFLFMSFMTKAQHMGVECHQLQLHPNWKLLVQQKGQESSQDYHKITHQIVFSERHHQVRVTVTSRSSTWVFTAARTCF